VTVGAQLPPGEPAAGISLSLARWRSARFTGLRYALDLDLQPAGERIRGRMCLHWRFLAEAADVVLDWRGIDATAAISTLSANGVAVPYTWRDEHLVIAGAAFAGQGEHCLELEFESAVAQAGTPLTRYVDGEDGSEYLYTLLVPADASALFPCMDQPDLKACFTLALRLPCEWNAVANAPLESRQEEGGRCVLRFAPTPPLSTYLFAFAAGPFVEVAGEDGTRLFARRSQHARAAAAAPEVLQLNRDGLRWFEDAFACAYPFAKYDLVLIPEFAYAGMEHAGATFLREDCVLFATQPDAGDLLRRALLILHEAAHQWFGDLVTMRWFDDLWLKEGFANLMAYRAAAALLPQTDARIAWHRSKEIAGATDATAGTVPVRTPLDNLAVAKSAYGNIVYHKAPAVLQLAEHLVGASAFRQAIRDFLHVHAWGVAQWSDLVAALERACGQDLRGWAQAWVLQAGMPRIECEWRLDDGGRLGSAVLHQRPLLPAVSGASAVWPQRVQVQFGRGARIHASLEVVTDDRALPLADAAGLPAPDWVFANAGDHGYGWFALDPHSLGYLLRNLPQIEDAFLRALLWDAMWQAVREARVAPLAWIELLLRGIAGESDELTVTFLLGALQRTLGWYVTDAARDAVQARVEDTLRGAMQASGAQALPIAFFRAYAALARSARARDDCDALLQGTMTIRGVTLRSADRFRLVRTLIAQDDARGEAWLERVAAADGSDDARRMAFAAAAARPGATAKALAFERLLDPQLPQRWVEEAATAFNAIEHAHWTLPFLETALRALPRLARERRIFFVAGWLEAFVGGQRSAAAEAVVAGVLRDGGLSAPLQRKLLEAHDALERCVRIRARYAD